MNETRRQFLAASAGAVSFAAAASLPGVCGAVVPNKVGEAPLIALLTLRGRSRVEDGFQNYFARRRLAVRFQAYELVPGQSDPSELRAMVRAVRPDLIYARGTPAALTLAGRYDASDGADYITDIPIVFVNVTDPVSSGLMPPVGLSGRNVTGSTSLAPLIAQLRAMLAYKAVGRIGIVFNSAESYMPTVLERLRRLTEAWDIDLIETPAALINGLPQPDNLGLIVDAFVSHKCDFLYLPPDPFVNEHAYLISERATHQGLATFCSTEASATKHTLMGLYARHYNLGQLAGYQAEQILSGNAQPETMPIAEINRFSLVVNMVAARISEVYPPLSLLRIAEIVS